MNKELRQILLQHYNTYPKMQLQDMVKLIYQNEFAGGHFIDNESESLMRLKSEIGSIGNECSDNEVPLFEDIGNGLVRLYLNRIHELQIDAETINRFFINTSNTVCGSVESFVTKAGVLIKLCEEGLLPFSADEAERYMKILEEKGYPPVSHSEEYRKAYNPHYRVVRSEYMKFFDVFLKTDMLLKIRETVIIAIDGNSGAGKSFLAGLLGDVYDCNIFHMDDFFLTPDLRTAERLSEAGGNVDYERFRREVLDNIRKKEVFSYRRYNCSTGSLEKPVQVYRKRLNIVEGCYSMHPALADEYDLKIFLGIGRETQIARILERNGPEMLKRFIYEWIPLEDRYFSELDIPGKCDLVYRLHEFNG